MSDATPSAYSPASYPTAAAENALARPSTEPKAHPVIEQQLLLRARLRNAPAALASLAGPDHLVSVANDLFRQLFGGRPLVGLALRTALPELADQPFFPLLDDAYRSGRTSYGHEAVAFADPAARREPLYFTFMAQAVRDAAGSVEGLLLFAYNVSAHVQARGTGTPPPTATAHELALTNEELATTNEELATTNEELATTVAQLSTANARLQASNADILAQAQELRRTHKALRHLNQQLEDRVAERTAQLRDALRQTEQARAEYAEALDHTPALVCLLRGPAHRYEFVNRHYQHLYPNRLLVGRTLAEAMPEAEAQGFGGLLDRVYATGETYRGQEMSMADVGPHGPRERFFDFTYQAARAHGEIVGVDVCAFDVTDQVRVRQQVAVAILRGPHYVIELANPAICTFWGRTSAQVLGQPLFDALPELVGQGFEELLAGVRATGVAHVAREVPATLDRPGGRDTAYYNFTYQSLSDADSISGITVVASDVTEQVLARQRLEQAGQELAANYAALHTAHGATQVANEALSQRNALLADANQDLDNFVYAASHDLKLPVLNLAGLFHELRRSITFTDAAEEALLVPLITQALHQLSTSLDDLAALGHAQQAAHAPAEPVGLEALIEEILHTLEPQVRAARARITTDFAARPTLRYPRASLRTVLLNLLSNALKYADPARPARIHCSLWLADGEPVLWVKDNGLGFDAAGHGPELFQLFHRFHTHVEGTGVGLYLVNRLLRARGGHLEVDSQVGAGTTFRAYLGPA